MIYIDSQPGGQSRKRAQNVSKWIIFLAYLGMPGTLVCYAIIYWISPTNPQYLLSRILASTQNVDARISLLILGFIFEMIMERTAVYTLCWISLFIQIYLTTVKNELSR